MLYTSSQASPPSRIHIRVLPALLTLKSFFKNSKEFSESLFVLLFNFQGASAAHPHSFISIPNHRTLVKAFFIFFQVFFALPFFSARCVGELYYTGSTFTCQLLFLRFLKKIPSEGSPKEFSMCQFAYTEVILRYSSRQRPLSYTFFATSLPRYLTCQGSYI